MKSFILVGDVMKSIDLLQFQQGTIHILRKHLYTTKFDLTTFFRQNVTICFSTLHFDEFFMLLRSVNFKMSFWYHRFDQNTNEKI